MITGSQQTVEDGIRIEEYRALRQELDGNRKFVFERPLLIAGGTLAAVSALPAEGNISLLCIPFLTIHWGLCTSSLHPHR